MLQWVCIGWPAEAFVSEIERWVRGRGGAADASRLIRRGRWDGTEMLDLRGEVFPRMGLFVLGFQGGGERRGSEIRR